MEVIEPETAYWSLISIVLIILYSFGVFKEWRAKRAESEREIFWMKFVLACVVGIFFSELMEGSYILPVVWFVIVMMNILSLGMRTRLVTMRAERRATMAEYEARAEEQMLEINTHIEQMSADGQASMAEAILAMVGIPEERRQDLLRRCGVSTEAEEQLDSVESAADSGSTPEQGDRGDVLFGPSGRHPLD